MLFFQKEFGHKEQIIKDWEGENSMNDLAIKMQLSERISKSLLSKKNWQEASQNSFNIFKMQRQILAKNSQ